MVFETTTVGFMGGGGAEARNRHEKDTLSLFYSKSATVLREAGVRSLSIASEMAVPTVRRRPTFKDSNHIISRWRLYPSYGYKAAAHVYLSFLSRLDNRYPVPERRALHHSALSASLMSGLRTINGSPSGGSFWRSVKSTHLMARSTASRLSADRDRPYIRAKKSTFWRADSSWYSALNWGIYLDDMIDGRSKPYSPEKRISDRVALLNSSSVWVLMAIALTL